MKLVRIRENVIDISGVILKAGKASFHNYARNPA